MAKGKKGKSSTKTGSAVQKESLKVKGKGGKKKGKK